MDRERQEVISGNTSRRRGSLWKSLCALLVVIGISISGSGLTFGINTTSRLENGCPMTSRLSTSEWVCFTLDEEAARQMKELALEETLVNAHLDTARARAKRLKRLGWSLGPGFGIGIGGKDNGGFEPDLGVYLSYGFRF